MADASRKAATNVKRGGLTNALFLTESAERLPGILAGRADLITVVLPWGSLRHGILAADHDTVTSLRGLLRADGELLLFLSETDREQVDALVSQFDGFEPLELWEATESDVAELSSGWARRLGIPGRRVGWLARLQAGPGGESASRSLV